MKRKPSMGRICPGLATALCGGLLACLSPQTAAGTEDERPLVLQYQVSHPRNTDQVSLIFRQEDVELVVNKDYWQEEAMPRRLGRFRADYNGKLSRLKRRLERYHHRLMSTVPLLSLMDIPDLPPMRERRPDPHAPRLSLGGEEIPSRHRVYEDLFGILESVWDHRWRCFECASYRIEGDSIVRTMSPSALDSFELVEFLKALRKALEDLDALEPPPFNVDDLFESSHLGRYSVSWVSERGERLECVRRGHDGARMECLDSRFGLFELPIPVEDTPPAPGS